MRFHQDAAFAAQLKRTVGYCVHGGAELSECFSVIQTLRSRDYKGWHDAWRLMADQLRQSTIKEIEQCSNISAGEKLLRCSNYYRTAYFFLEKNRHDERILECLTLSKESFKKALELLKIKHLPLKIPFEGIFLPGYLYLPENPLDRLLIDTGGGDSTLEEIYFYSVAPALKRGYPCLTFEGPGQGSVLRMQQKPFQSNWEVVIQAVINYIQNIQPGTSDRIILRGDSFGGYLAARAAAYEKRIRACILNPGVLNSSSSLNRLSSKWIRSILFFLLPSLKFKIESRFMRFNAHSFSELNRHCSTFNLYEEAGKIACPTLIIDNEEEQVTPGEALKLYEQLQCAKTYHQFHKSQSTGGHCQPLAQQNTQEILFDWLDTIF